jgi:quinoprotein glucose dehydrogenase
VSYWEDANAPPDHACRGRILFGTQDARLFALDVATGTPCADFGNGGFVDLNEGTRGYHPGNYLITSPPAIHGDLVITGSAIGDNSAVTMELGIVRAVDARTGNIVWAWDPIPRDATDPAFADWQASQVDSNSAANAWSVLSVDEALGLVFVPTGSASPDFYGGERLGSNRNANSVVALNAQTGEVVWARQLVHHDIWDYDVPAQPVLVDLTKDGVSVPALVQITKMGMMFVLDRRDGSAVFPIEERAVPKSDVDGESAWPTQPFSSLPPLVSQAPVTVDEASGLIGLDWLHCRSQIARYRSEGIYTPPSLQGTLLRPAYAGGGNWGSVSFDPARQYAVTNLIHIPAVVQLLPRDEFERQREDPDHPDSQYTAQNGTPYGMRREILTSFLGVPCTDPPWGTLAAMDLLSGTIAWQVPLGTSEDLAPWPFQGIEGVPNIGGSIVTAGGLVFIGAAMDDYLRAFDIDTGKELWKGRLPAGGQATPMSYAIDGRQYVVIAAGGHGGAGTTLGDYVVAFGL